MKQTLIQIVMLIALAFPFFQPGAALAQDDLLEKLRGQGVRGQVTALNGDSLTVTRANGSDVVVETGNETLVFELGQDFGNLDDVQIGTFVAVRGKWQNKETFTARLILILPDDPRNLAGAWGKLMAIDGDVLTIKTPGGDRQVATDAETQVIRGKEIIGLPDLVVGDPLLAMGRKQDDGPMVAITVFAPTDEFLKKHTLRGNVLSVDLDAGALTVEAVGHKEGIWTIQTTEQTRYRIRGVEQPTLADVEEGDEVVIVGRPDEADSRRGTARLIAVVPEALAGQSIALGEVMAINGTSFTLQTVLRGEFTILTTEATVYRTRSGKRLTFDDLSIGRRVLVVGEQLEDQEQTVRAKIVGLKGSE